MFLVFFVKSIKTPALVIYLVNLYIVAMATSFNGTVRLTYGNHTHTETFDSTTKPLTPTNQVNAYSSGQSRVQYSATTGTAIDKGSIGSSDVEGLLLIKNVNTVGDLQVSMDSGANWDIKIPAGLVNIISVGPDHDVHVRATLPQYPTGLASDPTTSGAVTLDAAVTAATYLMTATANPDHTATDNRFILKVNKDGASGIAYGLDAETIQTDLASTYNMSSTTSVTLDEVVDYRYTLTER